MNDLMDEVGAVLHSRGAQPGSAELHPRRGVVTFVDSAGAEVTLTIAAVQHEAAAVRRRLEREAEANARRTFSGAGR